MNAIPVEYASERKIRDRNKLYYRFNHWPIWIFVFFIAPGPLTFDLFERGFDTRMALWLGAVLLGTGAAGLRGSLPGVEPRPYIIRFTEDRPNPLYRRVCYTFAWSAVITFAVLNAAGLVIAIVTVIGGLGSLPGAIIAGLLVGGFENLFQYFRGVTERDLYVMLLLFAFLVFRPGGIFSPAAGRD